MSYQPKPIDTTNIELGSDILELIERLAKNTHDIWSQQRFKEGWKYGEKRNDERKENPCLIKYEMLPESEKEYDRNTAMETLKAIITLGYRIERD